MPFKDFLEGKNVAALIFGVMISGKSLTLMGNLDLDRISDEYHGIVPKQIKCLLNEINAQRRQENAVSDDIFL